MANQEHAALRALIAKWRNEAAAKDTFHATMGVGWKVCASELEAALAAAPAQGCQCPSPTLVGGVCACQDAAPAQETGEPQDVVLRCLLWTEHFKGGDHRPYGDDGEMQCCGIDFKRWSPELIAERLNTLKLQRLMRQAEAQPTPPPLPPPAVPTREQIEALPRFQAHAYSDINFGPYAGMTVATSGGYVERDAVLALFASAPPAVLPEPVDVEAKKMLALAAKWRAVSAPGSDRRRAANELEAAALRRVSPQAGGQP